ncbi:FAD-binding protein [Wenjunlia tyrosinilytica]|uniref:FAD-binding protein n=1 Tax=Wenjunlia tyrosinilytica TaxID=1544741 RepID=UPI001E4E7B90|nr:FAD-binding protein [Wenjunlia tyrosinilytica]
MAAGVAVIGFDPLARSWVPASPKKQADRSANHNSLVDVPPLDGTLLTDDASLSQAADDFGHIVHRRPTAVLRPGSVSDVVTMVRFCNTHGLKTAPRGQGHATFGQAQVEGGLVIETTPLDRIGTVGPHSVAVGPHSVAVGAGARWSDVVRATLEHGLTPAVFTDYLELSVGGTLSVGGLGGQTHRHGAQVDNVTALQVVTGAGELVRCSASRHPDLFHAVLAGLGQCAIVVGATIRLVTAPRTVRHYLLPYNSLRTFLEDQRRLVEERRFAYVEGQIAPDAQGAFNGYVLEAVAYGPPAGPEPDDTELLRGLRFNPSGVQKETLDYFDFLNRLAPAVEALKAAGLWAYAHPWLNLLLPGDEAESVAGPILSALTPDDVGPAGVVLLYPLIRERLHTPLLRMPDDPVPYLLAVLRTCPPDDEDAVARLLRANRRAFETVRDAGGTQYPVGSIPFRHADWRRQYGPVWPRFAAARHRYDPLGVLVPGQGVF